MRPQSPPKHNLGSQLMCGEHMEEKGGGQGQMGDTRLWRAPSTQFQVPAEWDEHQTFSMQQDQVFLWGSWYSWRLRVGGIWCPL